MTVFLSFCYLHLLLFSDWVYLTVSLQNYDWSMLWVWVWNMSLYRSICWLLIDLNFMSKEILWHSLTFSNTEFLQSNSCVYLSMSINVSLIFNLSLFVWRWTKHPLDPLQNSLSSVQLLLWIINHLYSLSVMSFCL